MERIVISFFVSFWAMLSFISQGRTQNGVNTGKGTEKHPWSRWHWRRGEEANKPGSSDAESLCAQFIIDNSSRQKEQPPAHSKQSPYDFPSCKSHKPTNHIINTLMFARTTSIWFKHHGWRGDASEAGPPTSCDQRRCPSGAGVCILLLIPCAQ